MRIPAAVLAILLSNALPAAAQTGDATGEGAIQGLPELGPAVFLAIDGQRAYRVEDWIGATVRLSGSGEEIGDIENLMLGRDGQTLAAILGVGGFLGIGEKKVAVDIASLRAAREDGEMVLELNATREQIENAERVVLDD